MYKVLIWIALVASLAAAGLGGYALYRSLRPTPVANSSVSNTATNTPGNTVANVANNDALDLLASLQLPSNQ